MKIHPEVKKLVEASNWIWSEKFLDDASTACGLASRAYELGYKRGRKGGWLLVGCVSINPRHVSSVQFTDRKAIVRSSVRGMGQVITSAPAEVTALRAFCGFVDGFDPNEPEVE